MTSLLARTSAADRHFERLYRKHVADVYRYTLAVLRNPQDAEDVTQTTFMNAYRAMQNGERPEVPKNWLIAIAHNACRQRFRQEQRRPKEMPLFEEAAEAAVEDHEDEYSAEDIRRALGYLAFNQRSALVMRELEGRSYEQIAAIMGLNLSAVETLIFRARRALREQLEGTLTCAEAEFLLSKQADGALSRPERGQLRAHLRECEECATAARSQRASRGALKAMFAAVPVPTSLGSLFGGGSTVGVAVAAKAAAVVAATAVVGGVGYEGAKQTHIIATHSKPPAARAPNLVPAKRNQVGVSSATGRASGRAKGSLQATAARGFAVPKGATHLKIDTHLKITRGFVVPPGATHLRITSKVKIIPTTRPAHPARPSHPSPAATTHAKNPASQTTTTTATVVEPTPIDVVHPPKP